MCGLRPKKPASPPLKQRQRQGIIKRLLPSPALKHWEGVNIQSTHSSHKISNFSPAQPSPSSQHLQQFGFRFRSQIPPQGF